MPVGTTFKGGLELKFFENREFESIEGIDPSLQAPIIARNALRFLMMGWTQSWTEFLTSDVARATLVERNPELLKELRFAFQQGFDHLFKQLEGNNLTPDQSEQVQLYLSNCMSLLPYGDLTPYESIKIPQCINGKWEQVEYQVAPIELTEPNGWRRVLMRDEDRVFAYGLEPLFNRDAESHLIFMGTTYPSGQGFLTQVNTDSKGFETVGKSLYRTGRARIQEWLTKQGNAIHVCGVSLGGSLSLLLAIDKGDYTLSRVDALTPAGLHDAWSKSRYDHWDNKKKKPRVVVQKQGDDPVSAFGVWKKEWDILKVMPPKEKQGPNGLCDHFLNYAGFAETEFTYVDPEKDNLDRKARNFWLYSVGRSFIYYCFLVPYTYVVRPIGYFVAENWVTLAHVAGVAVVAGLAIAGILPALAFLGIAAGLLVSGFAFAESRKTHSSASAKKAQDLVEREGLAKLHDPSLSRNPTMDIYDVNNSVEMTLTAKNVHTYYQVMRGLVKGKELVPSEEKASKHVKGITKKSLLEFCQDSQNAEEVIPFKVTKAKASHIRHTLTLVEKLGIDNQEKLKPQLEKSYAEYRIGKH